MFSPVFESLLNDENRKIMLSQNIKRLALPQATKQIVDEIVKLIQK
jgi:UDP-N-acetylglucosamine--N-acetylmuramyl-(pentapeptide) pyrophosphoryl-undecaprenol N-acetylglucosamine transferase